MAASRNVIDIGEMLKQGYCNKYGVVSRIDRPDWHAFLEQEMGHSLIIGDGQWEDHYRRCYSRDTVALGADRARIFSTSGWDKTGYVPKKGDPPATVLRPTERVRLILSDASQPAEQRIERALELLESTYAC
jgi:hypothetical protein